MDVSQYTCMAKYSPELDQFSVVADDRDFEAEFVDTEGDSTDNPVVRA